jgi:single-strand DNA-binding protein
MINKVILVGNVGKDPELRHLDNDRTVARFPLATSETYKNKNGEKITNTDWHNIVAWRGLAELAGKYIKKGSQIYVEGKIRNRSWEDKDGNKRYTTEIDAEVIQFLGKRPDDGGQQSTPGTFTTPEVSANGDAGGGGFDYNQGQVSNSASDDLPF